MFRKFSSGMFVPCGTYLNTKDWEFHSVAREGGVLEGESVTYYRLPLLLVIALAPVIGLAFILFLPVAVPAVVIYGLGRRFTQNTHTHRPQGLARRAGGGR